MKAAIGIFVAFLLAAFLLLNSKKNAASTPPPAISTLDQHAPTAEDVKNQTTIQWIDSVKTVGKIKNGEKVEISFRFKNTGDKQLVITSVIVSCGCTVAEKPEQPIAPGEEGVIKAEFNSAGRLGTNHKTITVQSNTPGGISTLNFDVEVVDNI
jgi:Protein of unknown function (DUF1573)